MDQSFLDPQSSSDGTPYAPKRIRSLVKEFWFLCDNLHIGYEEALDMSVIERSILLQLMKEKADNQKKMMDQMKAEAEARRNSQR